MTAPDPLERLGGALALEDDQQLSSGGFPVLVQRFLYLRGERRA